MLDACFPHQAQALIIHWCLFFFNGIHELAEKLGFCFFLSRKRKKPVWPRQNLLYLQLPNQIIMQLAAQIIIGLVAAIHIYILWLEMFAWTTKAPKVFKSIPEELFPKTKTLAANQGLYNGFLAAGLIWSLCITDHHWKLYVAIFFLTCVIIAGIYGATTASKKILYVQSIPALVAMILLHLR